MVSKHESAIEKLDVQRAIRRTTKVIDIQESIAQLESEQPPCESAELAIAELSRRGINVVEMNRGELMLEASLLGLINVVRALECPQYRLETYVNGFGEGLLHYAAKGNQEKMVAYLLKRGIDPNIQNKFKETPIFIAAEMGAKQVLHTLYSDRRTKADLQDKFGDTIMHFAARDGQFECLEYIISKTKKLMNVTNQEGRTPLHLATLNDHITCSQYLRNQDAPMKCGNRQLLIKELAEKYVNMKPDFRQSVISKQKDTGPDRIQKPLVKKPPITREEIEREFLTRAIKVKEKQLQNVWERINKGEGDNE